MGWPGWFIIPVRILWGISSTTGRPTRLQTAAVPLHLIIRPICLFAKFDWEAAVNPLPSSRTKKRLYGCGYLDGEVCPGRGCWFGGGRHLGDIRGLVMDVDIWAI